MRGGVAHNFKGFVLVLQGVLACEAMTCSLLSLHMYLRFVIILYCALPPFFYFAHKIYRYKNTSRVLYSRLAFCTT